MAEQEIGLGTHNTNEIFVLHLLYRNVVYKTGNHCPRPSLFSKVNLLEDIDIFCCSGTIPPHVQITMRLTSTYRPSASGCFLTVNEDQTLPYKHTCG